jgi:hypothetical protein
VERRIVNTGDSTRKSPSEHDCSAMSKQWKTGLLSWFLYIVGATFFIVVDHIKHDCYHDWFAVLQQHCSFLLNRQLWTALSQQHWTVLLTTLFSVGSKTLFKLSATALFVAVINPEQVGRFYACSFENTIFILNWFHILHSVFCNILWFLNVWCLLNLEGTKKYVYLYT